MTRESFVLHTEYIEDLPEEYKQKFLFAIYQYAAHDIVPEFTGLEQTIWIKIQRRIDADVAQWEETKQKRSDAGRRGGLKSGEQRKNEAMFQSVSSKTKQNEAMLQSASNCFKQNEAMLQSASNCFKQNEANEAVSVSDNVNVSVSESESVSVGAQAPENSPSDFSFLQKTLFSMIQTHNKDSPVESKIPVSTNFVSFIQKECRELFEVMRGSPPDEILHTVENLLISAKQKRKKAYSWHWFLKDINDYKPEFFCVQKAEEQKQLSPVDDFYKKMRGSEGFDAGIFLAHQKEWLSAGKPEGNKYFAWQAEYKKIKNNA